MRETQPSATAFGLVAWLEQTRIALPLKGVECRFRVHGDLLHVELDQIFHQNATRALDCTYTFPLPADAAVYRCEMRVNDRVIRAMVEEGERAREIFAQKKAEGKRAAMVEMERENLFTLSLGNVQPEDVIVVRLGFFQVLERTGDSISLRVPVCPGIRYIPGGPLLRANTGRGTVDDTDQVPDASRITPPRIDALHPDAAYFFLEGKIDESVVIGDSITSPSHAVLVSKVNNTPRVALAGSGAVPDRDFVLRWNEPRENRLKPLAWTCENGGAAYTLVQLRAPEIASAQTEIEQDIYFLIDRSGSMAGMKWKKSCDALRAFVSLLGERDRVWITFFESHFRDFAEKPLSPARLRDDKSFRNIDQIGVTGGTELLPALKHVLQKVDHHSANRSARLILITDGQVGNEAEIIAMMRAHPRVTLHAFGIDTVVNDAFLKRLAGQQRGRCALCTPNDDIARAVAELAARLRRPVLTQLRPSEDWELASESLPDLFAGEVLDISLRAPSAAIPLAINAVLPDGSRTTIPFQPKLTRDRAISLLYARERIAMLLATNRRAEAIALAKTHNLLCDGVAFIAWDEQEKVALASDSVYQPSLAPGGWEISTVCDAPAAAPYVIAPAQRLHSIRPQIAQRVFVKTARSSDWKSWRRRGGLRLRVRLTRWRRALSALPFFQRPEGEEILDLLCFWAAEKSSDGAKRWAALRALHDQLIVKPNEAGEILLGFFQREISDSALSDRALALLEPSCGMNPRVN